MTSFMGTSIVLCFNSEKDGMRNKSLKTNKVRFVNVCENFEDGS